MYRIFVFIFFISVFGLTLHSKNVICANSVFKIYSAGDSISVKLFNDSAWTYIFSDKKKALFFIDKAYHLSKKSKNPHSLSDCYNTLGVYHYINGNYDTSIYYHNQALAIRKTLKDKPGLMKSYNNIASAQKAMGMYTEEIQNYFKALNISEELKDSLTEAAILTNIAGVFEIQKQNKKAHEYTIKALQIRKNIRDVKGQISSYIQLGLLKYNEKDFTSAREYFLTSQKIAQNFDDNFIKAKIHANLGAVLKEMALYDEAIKEINLSIPLNQKMGNTNSNLINLINLAAIYEITNQVDKAFFHYNAALNIARKNKVKIWEKQAYLGIATTSYLKGNYKKAYENYVLYSTIKDSLQTTGFHELLAKNDGIYKLSKKESEISDLKKQEELYALTISNQQLSLQKRKTMLLGSGIIIVLILFFFYFNIRTNKIRAELKKELVIRETRENERLRMAKDIHDELGSGLSKITFLSEVKYNASSKAENKLEAISETSRGLVDNMRDMIWALNPENSTLDNLIVRIREYCADYLEDFPVELNSFYPESIPSLHILKDSQRHIFLTVKEALNNVVKHSGSDKVHINVSIEQDLIIKISDNGRGFNPSQNSHGNGLKNMKHRIEKSGGSFSIYGQEANGCSVIITIPLNAISCEGTEILL